MSESSLDFFLIFSQFFILLYFLTVNSLYTIFMLLASWEIGIHQALATHQKLKNKAFSVFYRPISVIVPAFNEEKVIVSNVRSLLSLDYPEFEVVVINDGSTDSTLSRLMKEFNLVRAEGGQNLILSHEPIRAAFSSPDHPALTVIDKVNGGKADALNAGINISRYPVYCCIDADTFLAEDALLKVSRFFFEDREVIAAGSVLRILNGSTFRKGKVVESKAPKKGIECFQVIEYARAFLAGRTAWNLFGSLLIISGAFGVFRKDMVMAVQGYRKNTVGEDLDLVVRLHKYCKDKKIFYKIHFIPDPVCWTQAPSDITSLLKQRNRWARGLIESLWYNKEMLLNLKYGTVGLLAFPYFLFVEVLAPFVEFGGYAIFILLALTGQASQEFILMFFAFAILWGTCLNLGAIYLDGFVNYRYRSLGDNLKLTFYALIETFGFRQLILTEKIIAIFQIWKTHWDQPTRQEIHSEPNRRTI